MDGTEVANFISWLKGEYRGTEVMSLGQIGKKTADVSSGPDIPLKGSLPRVVGKKRRIPLSLEEMSVGGSAIHSGPVSDSLSS